MDRTLLLELLLYSPAFVANAAPVIAASMPGLRGWKRPISPSLFGKNKTIRGLCAGVVTGGLVAVLLDVFDVFLLDTSVFWIGCLLGFGALAGDVAESFLKRRLGLAPGQALPVLDGIDYVVGALLILLPWYTPSMEAAVLLLLAGPLLSLAANTAAFAVGMKDRWY